MSNWRQATTFEDATQILMISEEAEARYYSNSETKGAVQKKSEFLFAKFGQKSQEWWIYEEGQKRIALGMMKHEGVGQIERICTKGFGTTMIEEVVESLPIAVKKVREIMAESELYLVKSLSPRTLRGEAHAWFAQTYLPEATVTLHSTDMHWVIEIRREAMGDDKVLTKVREATVEADAVPQGYEPKDIPLVSRQDITPIR